MVKLGNVHDVKIEVNDHVELGEFLALLKEVRPPALYTSVNGETHHAFVNAKHPETTIHGYTGSQKINYIIEEAEERGIPIVNGEVMTTTVSPIHGERIYRLFGIQEVEESLAKTTYETALNLIKEGLPKASAGVLYQDESDDSKAVVDVGYGINHFTIILDGKNGRTLENTLQELKEYGRRPGKLPDDVLEYIKKE